jgi:NAD(P)-dependent dehydrogenase (short-subunit alcohol dehydrogenase family)
MLSGKRIVVTGAGRGVGRSAVEMLLSQGALVIGVGKDSARLAQATKELAKLGDFSTVTADLSQPVCGVLVAQVVQRKWGALDILVNNAGIHLDEGGMAKENPEILEQLLNVNVLGPQRMICALLDLLEKGEEPRVLNVSSEAGQTKSVNGKRGDPSYSLSKHTLNALTRIWADALHGKVAVNCMHPGWVKTDMAQSAPDPVTDGGTRVCQALKKPWKQTGKFWFGEEEMEW